MRIEDFEPGEAIVRVERGGFNKNDGSYIGTKVYLLCILNGQIYLEHDSDPTIGDKAFSLNFCDWAEGWDMWIEPEFGSTQTTHKTLEKRISEAIEDENYELAETLKNKLKEHNDTRV